MHVVDSKCFSDDARLQRLVYRPLAMMCSLVHYEDAESGFGMKSTLN